MQTKIKFSILCTLLLAILSCEVSLGQRADSAKVIHHVGGAVTLTNNGVSLLPTFSLGKPAVMFDLNVGNKKISFEPQFRFALEGKPWSFIFWWRYKLLNSEKFKIGIGAHPALIFRTVSNTINGVTTETLEAQRYLATEFAPNYFIRKDISIGIYYLQSHGFAESTTHQTHFITINSNFANIRFSEKFFMKFNPQVFYLKMDAKDGYYASTTITLAKNNFPLTIQSILNQAIKTNIITKSNFVWNLSLIYSFRNEYQKP